ncbi:hypothetical protein FB382_003775 [Nocardioides ginsengisegetis]|uniref:Uncharacterized protein n=2 Tax=Nocardioides ginsengisegetis TaxID=661491 RepID=A0A7W3PBJ0_9ACTN|nr:hypothetical protein [Nocardioides ginsengisegetis]
MENRVGWALVAPSHADLVFLTSDVPAETAILPVTAAPIPHSPSPAVRSVRRARISNSERLLWMAALSVVALLGAGTTFVIAHQPHSVPAHCLAPGKDGVVLWICADTPSHAQVR